MTLLREAGHNPDEHLTDEQRERLISAEYYDRLNIAMAYFPASNGGQPLMQEGGPDGMVLPGGAPGGVQNNANNMEGMVVVG